MATDRATKRMVSTDRLIAPAPAVVAALVILALIGVFALYGGRTLVRPSGLGDAKVTGQPAEAAAVLKDGVQRITVDPRTGLFDPNVIVTRQGIPLEIEFRPGTGQMATVAVRAFKVSQDISKGAVVKLPAMRPGEYEFACGMQVVFGKIVVK